MSIDAWESCPGCAGTGELHDVRSTDVVHYAGKTFKGVTYVRRCGSCGGKGIRRKPS